MKNQTTTERIEELKTIQNEEAKNNFLNGDLWNECEDKIYFLNTYGQETEPKKLIDENGYVIGIILNDGTTIEHSGMTFENSY